MDAPLNLGGSTEVEAPGRAEFLNKLRDSRWGIVRGSVPEGMTDNADYDCFHPMEISITDDGLGWKAKDPFGRETWAEILSVDRWNGEWSVVIKYDQETRLGPDGNPLTWRLVMVDDDHFFWRWLASTGGLGVNRSKVRMRCPAAAEEN